MELATIYVPEYTPQIKRNDGCDIKKTGLVKSVFAPLINAGTIGSRPLAFETRALSTIEIAGANQQETDKINYCLIHQFKTSNALPTENADKMAAQDSTVILAAIGEKSSCTTPAY